MLGEISASKYPSKNLQRGIQVIAAGNIHKGISFRFRKAFDATAPEPLEW